MRKKLRSGRPSHATVVAYLALFAALGGTTYAATGGNFILGQPNSASSRTSLSAPIADRALQVTNTNTGTGATALGLNVAAGRPPFTVNSGTKVANLNADKLDGKDSSAFRASNFVRRIDFDRTDVDTPFATRILTHKEMYMDARCFLQDNATHLFVSVGTSVEAEINYTWQVGTDDQTPSPEAKGTTIGAGLEVVPLTLASPGPFGWQRAEGQLVYRNASRVISVIFHAVANADTRRCQVNGTAVSAP
jgi:hypothetical protein